MPPPCEGFLALFRGAVGSHTVTLTCPITAFSGACDVMQTDVVLPLDHGGSAEASRLPLCRVPVTTPWAWEQGLHKAKAGKGEGVGKQLKQRGPELLKAEFPGEVKSPTVLTFKGSF